MKSPPRFVREATGLVRGFSPFDIFVQTSSILQVGIGVLFLLEYLAFFFPGADVVGLLIVCLVLGLAFALLWGCLTAAMPRSGGDYVWMTRILPEFPAVGFMYAIMYGIFGQMLFVGGFLTYFYVNGILSPTLTGIGLVYGIPAMAALGEFIATGNGLFITGILIWALAILTLSFRIGKGSRVINNIWAFSLVAVFVMIILGFASGTEVFRTAFDTQFGLGQYSRIFDLGKQAGFAGFASSSFVATLSAGFSLGYLSTYSNFQLPVWEGGEIRKSENTWKALSAALCLTAFMYIALVESMYHLMGAEWLGAVSMAANTPSTAASLPFLTAPTFVFFLTIAFRNNPIVVFLINAGIIAGAYLWFVVPIIANSRLIFSLSFDRFLPTALADVSHRSNVPIKAIVLVAALGILWFGVYTYDTFTSAFFGSLPPISVAWTFAALLFAFFPWLKRDLYEKTVPQTFRRKIGLPIITWLGLFIAITQAWASYAYITSSLYPTFGVEVILGIIIGSLITYYVTLTIRRRQGIDLDLLFSQVPPE